MIPFDGARDAQTAQEFIDHELVERLGATLGLGRRELPLRQPRAAATRRCCAAQDAFETRVVEMVELDGEIVSSTHIRGLIATGAVAEAARLLGAPFGMRGIVAHGDKRGRTLGFPTANLVPDPALAVPDHGIYACRAAVPGLGEWTAAVSIGVRPTFVTGRGLLVEAFLLDFDGDLYGRELRLDFVERIRGERRFDSAEALIEQMHRDVDEIAPAGLTVWTFVRVFGRRPAGTRSGMRVLLAHALTPKRRRIARVLDARPATRCVEVDEPDEALSAAARGRRTSR